MLSLRGFWSRHRRKVLISLGVLGSGYLVYKLYESHSRRLSELERQLDGARRVDELIKNQLQAHFENIQRVSDTTTLPYAMHYLRSRISEDLDLSHLTEKLMQGKGQSSALYGKEKLELWDRLKILSFTRTAASLWSMTVLCLYVRVQVNILGRQLYLEIARGSENSLSLTGGTVSSDSRDRTPAQQPFMTTPLTPELTRTRRPLATSEDEEGFRTPTSEGTKLPAPSCLPAPRKTRRVLKCKRQLWPRLPRRVLKCKRQLWPRPESVAAGEGPSLGKAPDEEFEEYLRHLIGKHCTGDRNEMALLPEGITELLQHEKLPLPLS